jgi:hypothetical protein
VIPSAERFGGGEFAMMGRQTGDQSQLFYLFNLDRRIPADHLLRRINLVVTRILVELRDKLAAFLRPRLHHRHRSIAGPGSMLV